MLSRTAPLLRAVGSVAKNRAVTGTAVRAFSSDMDDLARTALFDFHQELGGKMVPFAGYALPVQYPTGVLKEHMHTRADGCSSLFDVSHMGQIKMWGKDAVDFVESITVADVKGLKEGASTLSVITNEAGGILDDTIISNAGDHVFMVVNGACKHSDMEHMKEQMTAFGGDVTMEYLHDRQLLALQGDGAAEALSNLVSEDLSQLDFMEGRPMDVDGVACRVTRCGYTGEDGFEVSIPHDKTVQIAQAMLAQKDVIPAALGARDSLRLEAGLCLYGHDLNDTTSPVEGTLLWTIAKRRRTPDSPFVGQGPILEQIANGATRKRVGFVSEGAPAREGSIVFAEDGETEIGVVTSGTRSPVLKKNIGMAYINKGHFKLGTDIKIQVRKKMNAGKVTKMPFVPSRYYRKA